MRKKKTPKEEPSLPSAGLGDTIASFTQAIGITPCDGCKSRQRALNKLFPWLQQSRSYTEDEYSFVESIEGKNTLSNEEVNRIFSLYNEMFQGDKPLERCNCPGLIIKMRDRLCNFL